MSLILPPHVEEARRKQSLAGTYTPLPLPSEVKEVLLPNGVKLRQREIVRMSNGEPGVWYVASRTGLRVLATTRVQEESRILLVSLSYKNKPPSLADVWNVRAGFYPNEVPVVIYVGDKFADDAEHNVVELRQAG